MRNERGDSRGESFGWREKDLRRKRRISARMETIVWAFACLLVLVLIVFTLFGQELLLAAQFLGLGAYDVPKLADIEADYRRLQSEGAFTPQREALVAELLASARNAEASFAAKLASRAAANVCIDDLTAFEVDDETLARVVGFLRENPHAGVGELREFIKSDPELAETAIRLKERYERRRTTR